MTLAPRAASDAVSGPVEAAVAVVSTGAALARYAFSVTARAALDVVPLPRLTRVVRPRSWRARTAREAASARFAAEEQLSALADVLVPWLAREVLSRLDVVDLVREFVDVDRIAAGLDVDAVAARLDVDAVLDRMDLTTVVLQRVDLRPVVSEVLALIDESDITGVIELADLDRAAARLDVDAVARRLDVEAVLDRLDLTTTVLRRVDLRTVVDAALAQIDLIGLAEEVIDGVDLPEIIRESTGSMASDTVRGVRMQGIEADRAVDHAVGRTVDRLLLRRQRGAAGPAS